MTFQSVSTRQKILLAAIDIIEKKGLHAATVRAVAEAAGVNLASINYHFRTKGKLLEEVQRKTVENFTEEMRAIISDEKRDVRKTLQDFFEYVMKGAVRLPNMSKAHIQQTLLGGRYDTLFVRRLNELLGELSTKIQAAGPVKDKARLNRSLTHAFSGVMFTALMPKMYKSFSGINLEDDASRKAYIRSIVDDLLRRKPSDIVDEDD
jgi:TetR/AcrR family transcriptional regulator, regulator of cefoperazone and chloramphenicol sensitivity